MKKLSLTIIIILSFCITLLSGCDFFSPNDNNKLTISGCVYYNSMPLEGVSIKSSTSVYGKSDENGKFSIVVNRSSVSLTAEKTGYTFSPRSVEITQNTDNLIFTATKTENLNGLLTLSQVIITPSSIVSFGDDYSYEHEGNECLKIKDITLTINEQTYNLLKSDLYAAKNKSNAISFNDDVTISTGEKFNIWFSVDAYFESYQSEYVYQEDRQSVIRIQSMQTTENLNEHNQITYTAVGINSSNNMFTYNIYFVFDYYPNV